jgi:hypothetical protein
MYVAWKEYQPTPVLRTEVVPELGNKARHVTLSEYWLNVIQAPLAHLLIEAMKFHPSVFSSFHRQDQAFEAVKGLCSLKETSLKGPSWGDRREYILSSDLKDATNAQNWEVTKSLLNGFIQGFGLSSYTSDYIQLVLDLIGPRIVEFPDFETIVSKQGIMMGEAIAKPSLTILNLAIEELAFLDYTNSLETLMTHDPAPYRLWRYCHIGGDDHLVRGPAPYLNLITDYHRRAGSHISPGQHGYSDICVKYTERLINIGNLVYKKPFHETDNGLSTIVDSVKVRLLTRGSSTMLKKDNKNVAIGKSAQLGGCLEWLPKDNNYYTETKKASIRALFVERMGSLLPRKAKNPRAYAAIHLPTSVGGYGLGMKSELKYFLEASPEPHRWLVSKHMMGVNVKKDLRIFRKLNSNVSTRGVEDILAFQEDLIDRLNSYPTYINAISFWELREKYPSDNTRRTIALAEDDNILSVEEFVKRATRGNLFQELLLGAKDLKVFNTKKYVDTYRQDVWTYYEKEGGPDWETDFSDMTSEEIARALSKISPMWFFDVSQMTTVDIGTIDPDTGEETYEFVEGDYMSLYTHGLPSMNVSPRRLGLKL